MVAEFDPLLRIANVGDDAIGETQAAIQAWIDSPPFQRAIRSFDWDDDGSRDLTSRIDRLVALSDEWDFRKRTASLEVAGSHSESTRWTSNHSLLTTEQAVAASAAAKELGLAVASTPAHSEYDAVLVLGGARLSCLLRTQWAAEVVSRGGGVRETVLLASERPVGDSERDATDTYAPGAKTEFDLFVSAASEVYGIASDDYLGNRVDQDNPNLSWEIREYETHSADRVLILSAPSSEPERRRSNSADTYKFYLDQCHVPTGARLLLVTSPIYVPYQQLEAIRVLNVPMGFHVETIGFPPERQAELQGMQGPQHFLQEIRSFLQSSQRFLAAYPV